MNKMLRILWKVFKRIFWNDGVKVFYMFLALIATCLLSTSILSLPWIWIMHIGFWDAMPWGGLTLFALICVLAIFAKFWELWEESKEEIEEEENEEKSEDDL